LHWRLPLTVLRKISAPPELPTYLDAAANAVVVRAEVSASRSKWQFIQSRSSCRRHHLAENFHAPDPRNESRSWSPTTSSNSSALRPARSRMRAAQYERGSPSTCSPM
jgi:hypothetical protein